MGVLQQEIVRLHEMITDLNASFYTYPVPLSMTQAGCRPVIFSFTEFLQNSKSSGGRVNESSKIHSVEEQRKPLQNQDGDLPTARPGALWDRSEVWWRKWILLGVGTGHIALYLSLSRNTRIHSGIFRTSQNQMKN